MTPTTTRGCRITPDGLFEVCRVSSAQVAPLLLALGGVAALMVCWYALCVFWRSRR